MTDLSKITVRFYAVILTISTLIGVATTTLIYAVAIEHRITMIEATLAAHLSNQLHANR